MVYLGQGWSLYVFDTLRRVLHIIDQNICKPAESQMKAKHLRNAEELLDAFLKCGEMFWGEGKVPHNGWSYCFHPTCTYERSVLLAAKQFVPFLPSYVLTN